MWQHCWGGGAEVYNTGDQTPTTYFCIACYIRTRTNVVKMAIFTVEQAHCVFGFMTCGQKLQFDVDCALSSQL